MEKNMSMFKVKWYGQSLCHETLKNRNNKKTREMLFYFCIVFLSSKSSMTIFLAIKYDKYDVCSLDYEQMVGHKS